MVLDKHELDTSFHIQQVFDEDGNIVGWDYVRYEYSGDPIPAYICICAAWSENECVCGAWDSKWEGEPF